MGRVPLTVEEERSRRLQQLSPKNFRRLFASARGPGREFEGWGENRGLKKFWDCGGKETGVAVLPTLGKPHLLEGAGRLLSPGSELRVTEGRLLHFSCALLAIKPGPLPQWPPSWTWAGEAKTGEDIGGSTPAGEQPTAGG